MSSTWQEKGMLQRVKYACGDTQVIDLLSSSLRTREDILQCLRHTSCPACLRKSRYEDAHRCAEEAGLCPLQAHLPQQLALAEIIRVSLWRALLPQEADQDARHLLAAFFNRRSSASFWLTLRGWAMYQLTPEQVGHLLLSLLQPQVKGKIYD